MQVRTYAILNGRVGFDTTYDKLPDGSEIRTGERDVEAWRTEQDQLHVVSEILEVEHRVSGLTFLE